MSRCASVVESMSERTEDDRGEGDPKAGAATERPATDGSSDPGEEVDEVLSAFLGLTVPEGYRAELIKGEIVVTRRPMATTQTVRACLPGRSPASPQLTFYAVGNKGLVTPLGHFIPDSTIGPLGVFRNMEPWARPEGVVMVAEVTASRPEKDRGAKRRGYAAAGIPFYLLIDRTEGTITLYSTPKDENCREIVRVPFGKPLDLPEPFSFALDTAAFG